MNKELFVPYEEALAMKELGFDEPCLGLYSLEGSPNPILIKGETFTNTNKVEISNTNKLEVLDSNECTAPLYQQAFRWFREKYKLFGEVCLKTKQEDCEVFEFFVLNVNEPLFESNDYTVYEKAELACLRKLIEIVNQNKEDE